MGHTRKSVIIEKKDIPHLFNSIKEQGYTIVGPKLCGGAIVYDELQTIDDLPIGWTDEQSEARYRLKQNSKPTLFEFTNGPHSWKKYLFPPNLIILTGQRINGQIKFKSTSFDNDRNNPKYAFFGVRACELNAITIQDKIFTNDNFSDPYYKSIRENLLIVAVNCTKAGGTCFCASMKTGPKAIAGFDLSFTEILNETKHYFVVEVDSEKGDKFLMQVPHRTAEQIEIDEAEKCIRTTENQMGRTLEIQNVRDLLQKNLDHPHWAEIAERCLSCANCTMACPTCFCSTIEDTINITGDYTERRRYWDSCFTLAFSYIHGGSIRPSVKSRYRQWLTHKFSSWIDQFGTFGCVGCGRCITWCPVGIDITKVVKTIQTNNPLKA